MHMKKVKLISLLLALLLLLPCCLTGCRNVEEEGRETEEKFYEVYDTDVHYGLNYSAAYAELMCLLPPYKNNPNAAKEKLIIFEEEPYYCQYDHYSYIANDWQTDYDYYSCFYTDETLDHTRTKYFGIDIDSNTLVYVADNDGLQTFEKTPDDPDDIDEFLSGCAKEVASKYISLDEYKMTYMSERTVYTDYGDVHITGYRWFRFTRYVGEYATSDCLIVEIGENGILYAIAMQTLGSFADFSEEDLPEIDEEKFQASIQNYLWETSHRNDNKKYPPEKQFLAQTKEGKLVMVVSLLDVAVEL